MNLPNFTLYTQTIPDLKLKNGGKWVVNSRRQLPIELFLNNEKERGNIQKSMQTALVNLPLPKCK